MVSSKFQVPSSKSNDAAPSADDPRASSNLDPGTWNLELASDFALAVGDLRKTFRDPSGGALEVLRGVSFEVRAGEMTAVIGAAGAGETTLLHVVGGLEAADAGRARLRGFDVGGGEAAALARSRSRPVRFGLSVPPL